MQRYRQVPDVPTAVEFARNTEERQLLTLFVNGADVGYSIMSTPDLPADRFGVHGRAWRRGCCLRRRGRGGSGGKQRNVALQQVAQMGLTLHQFQQQLHIARRKRDAMRPLVAVQSEVEGRRRQRLRFQPRGQIVQKSRDQKQQRLAQFYGMLHLGRFFVGRRRERGTQRTVDGSPCQPL